MSLTQVNLPAEFTCTGSTTQLYTEARRSCAALDPERESLITTLTKLRPPKLEVINRLWGLKGKGWHQLLEITEAINPLWLIYLH